MKHTTEWYRPKPIFGIGFESGFESNVMAIRLDERQTTTDWQCRGGIEKSDKKNEQILNRPSNFRIIFVNKVFFFRFLFSVFLYWTDRSYIRNINSVFFDSQHSKNQRTKSRLEFEQLFSTMKLNEKVVRSSLSYTHFMKCNQWGEQQPKWTYIRATSTHFQFMGRTYWEFCNERKCDSSVSFFFSLLWNFELINMSIEHTFRLIVWCARFLFAVLCS